MDLAISLGPTAVTTAVALADGALAQLLIDGDVSIPTTVTAEPDGRVLTGRVATGSGEGRELNLVDELGAPSIDVAGHTVSLVDLVDHLLTRPLAVARQQHPEVKRLLLTYPVWLSQDAVDRLRAGAEQVTKRMFPRSIVVLIPASTAATAHAVALGMLDGVDAATLFEVTEQGGSAAVVQRTGKHLAVTATRTVGFTPDADAHTSGVASWLTPLAETMRDVAADGAPTLVYGPDAADRAVPEVLHTQLGEEPAVLADPDLVTVLGALRYGSQHAGALDQSAPPLAIPVPTVAARRRWTLIGASAGVAVGAVIGLAVLFLAGGGSADLTDAAARARVLEVMPPADAFNLQSALFGLTRIPAETEKPDQRVVHGVLITPGRSTPSLACSAAYPPTPAEKRAARVGASTSFADSLSNTAINLRAVLFRSGTTGAAYQQITAAVRDCPDGGPIRQVRPIPEANDESTAVDVSAVDRFGWRGVFPPGGTHPQLNVTCLLQRSEQLLLRSCGISPKGTQQADVLASRGLYAMTSR